MNYEHVKLLDMKKYFLSLVFILAILVWDAVPKIYCNNDFLCDVLSEINNAKQGSAHIHEMMEISQTKFDAVGWKEFVRNAQSSESTISMFIQSGTVGVGGKLMVRIYSTLATYNFFFVGVSRKYVEFDLAISGTELILVRATGHVLGP